MADPLRELAMLAAEVREWRAILGRKIEALGSLAGAFGPAPEVEMYERAASQLERILSSLARLGLDAHQAAVDERVAELLVNHVLALVAEFGHDPDAPETRARLGSFFRRLDAIEAEAR